MEHPRFIIQATRLYHLLVSILSVAVHSSAALGGFCSPLGMFIRGGECIAIVVLARPWQLLLAPLPHNHLVPRMDAAS